MWDVLRQGTQKHGSLWIELDTYHLDPWLRDGSTHGDFVDGVFICIHGPMAFRFMNSDLGRSTPQEHR